MKLTKIAYYGSTGLMTLMLAGGVAMYIFNHAEVATNFTRLGYPTYLIYPLALAKTLGLIAIWTRKSKVLADMAYAGFFFNLSLAVAAHVAVADGEFPGALICLVLALTSFFTQRRLAAGAKESAPIAATTLASAGPTG